MNPIPMILPCPKCGHRHVDEGEFATKLHHTHSCQICGTTWRPAVQHTVGVAYLPGFKNANACEVAFSAREMAVLHNLADAHGFLEDDSWFFRYCKAVGMDEEEVWRFVQKLGLPYKIGAYA